MVTCAELAGRSLLASFFDVTLTGLSPMVCKLDAVSTSVVLRVMEVSSTVGQEDNDPQSDYAH